MKNPFAFSRIRAVTAAHDDRLRSVPAPGASASGGRRPAARSLQAAWDVDPDTGRLECHWSCVSEAARRWRSRSAFAWRVIDGRLPAANVAHLRSNL
jgi:hypothetical protein